MEGRTLLVTASNLIPAAIEPVPDAVERPRRFHCLPRIFLAGVVSSRVARVGTNSECIFFNVTIDRRDVFPGVPFAVSCWVHRDQHRFSLLEQLAEQTPVIITGVGCGWTWDNNLMVDVYNIAYNNEGPPPPLRATDPPNPFYRAVFRDGFPTFPPRLPATAQRSLLCMDAIPSMSAPPPTVIHRERDPRLRAHSELSSVVESSAAIAVESTTGDPAPATDTVEGTPSVSTVRRAARSAAIRRVRSRVATVRQESAGSSPDVPLKLRISAKQLATIA